MRRRLLLAAFAALAPVLGAQTLPGKFDPARNAAADVHLALTLAQEQRKLVLVELGSESCTGCHVFERFVASRPAVRRTLYERYILVKVNQSPQNRNPALLSRWPKAKAYPHFYVLDAEGKVLASQPSSELEAGNDYDEARVLKFLQRNFSAP